MSGFIVDPYRFGASVPSQSIDFERSSTQYLSISDSDFGAYNRAKFAVSVWLKRESTGTTQNIFQHSRVTNIDPFILSFLSNNHLEISTSISDLDPADGLLNPTATYTSTANWYHILFHYDSANATPGDRMRLWVDGSEVTVFDTDTNPTAQIWDSSASLKVGASNSGGNTFDGLIYQLAFFSGSLPAIGSVYNAGSPMNITGLTGLWSVLDVAAGDVTSDGVLSANWTNNNTAVASSTIPS